MAGKKDTYTGAVFTSRSSMTSFPVLLEVLKVHSIREAFIVEIIVQNESLTFQQTSGHGSDLLQGVPVRFKIRECNQIFVNLYRSSSTRHEFTAPWASVAILASTHILSGGLALRYALTSPTERRTIGELEFKMNIDDKDFALPNPLPKVEFAPSETLRRIIERLEDSDLRKMASPFCRLSRFFLGSMWLTLKDDHQRQLEYNRNRGILRVDPEDIHHNAVDDLLSQIENQLRFLEDRVSVRITDVKQKYAIRKAAVYIHSVIARSAMLAHDWVHGYLGATYTTVLALPGALKKAHSEFYLCQTKLLYGWACLASLWQPPPRALIEDADVLVQMAVEQAMVDLDKQIDANRHPVRFSQLFSLLRGQHACIAFDMLLSELNSTGTTSGEPIRRLIARLSQSANQLPPSYEIPPELIVEDKESGRQGATNGGYANVYVSHLKERGKVRMTRIAVKELKPIIAKNKKQIFLEIINSKTLRHKNILNMIGFLSCNELGSMSLVFPWMQHGTCVKFLKQLKESRRRHLTDLSNSWIVEVAEGLEYLHREGVIHGDLRGDNILVDDKLTAVITDFGVSVYANAHSKEYGSTRTGNYDWLAPEQVIVVNGDHGPITISVRPTCAADVYSFAMCCIEMYTCQNPWFPGQAPRTITQATRPHRPRNPDETGDMAPDLWRLLGWCWHQEASMRPDAHVLIKELRGIVSMP